MALLRFHCKKQQKIIAEAEENGSRYGESRVTEWITKERPKQAHLYASTNLVFPDQHGCVPRAPIPRLECKAMLREAGITRSDFRWYDLRHTHATLLLTAGVPHKVVAERMGHSVFTLMTTYAHVLPDGGRSAAAIFQKLVPI
jgi:site-specific recombinase XerD